MTLEEYLSSIDESDINTTSAVHIAEVARHAAGCKSIVELGTHHGISLAAIALAAPGARVTAVDWMSEETAKHRDAMWASVGVPAGSVTQVRAEVGGFIRECVASGVEYDMVFHDATHGDAVVDEYIKCARMAKIVAIHDFELLNTQNRGRVEQVLETLHESADSRGRVLFVGRRR